MKITLSSIVAAAALLVSASAVAQEHKPDPKFQIYLCFGQSNMEAGAPPEEQDRGELDRRFQMLAAVDMPRLDRNKGHWYLATPPLNRQENNMGPVDWFGRNMVANLTNVLPNSHIVSSKGCKGSGDGLHFATAGLRELGKRYAIQMLRIQGFEFKEVERPGLLATPATQPATNTETASRTVEDGGTGLYPALMVSDTTLATHTIFRPKDLTPFGERAKLPIIAWGNGACANSPWEHVNFLSELASHGFLMIAIGPMPAEAQRGGARGSTKSSLLTDAIDWAIARNGDETSQYYRKLDTAKIAVAGMSCGGLQALEVAPDPRITTAMICNSGILANPHGGKGGMPSLTKDHLEKLHAPTIYILGGETDIAYNNGMDDFRRLNHVPVFAANLNVGHGGTYGQPHGGDFAKVATAWLQWHLRGDEQAAEMFRGEPCGVAKMEGWKVEKKDIR